MGTRNLTMVISNGKTKVAQYGQWDGYPSGQGSTALEFLHKIVDNDRMNEFKSKLNKVRFETNADKKEKDNFLKSLGSTDGWVNMEQGKKFDEKYRFDSRNHGAGIMDLILDAEEDEIILHDSTTFAADSLFCEWAYVVDLDKNTFEVYEGFNKTELTGNDRFYALNKKKDGEYYPVKIAASFSINELPTEDDFLATFKSEEVEED